VKKLERLDKAMAPDGTVLTLFRHDREYLIRVGDVTLMSTRQHHSEETIAELACSPLREKPNACVLVGGLGFGFTLAAVLRMLRSDAHVVVAEIVAAIIDWNRNPDYELADRWLRDERVDLRHDDVSNIIRNSVGAFDAIILDVDNGADALTTAGNKQLYSDSGIRAAVAALRPNGRLAYWSAGDDPAFATLLRRAGHVVETTRARRHEGSRGTHTIFVVERAPLSETNPIQA
jgi:spermidine synthase